MNTIPWDQLAVGVAAIVGLVYVARTMRRAMRDVLEFLGNHLSGVVEAQARVATSLDRVADRLERVEDKVAAHK